MVGQQGRSGSEQTSFDWENMTGLVTTNKITWWCQINATLRRGCWNDYLKVRSQDLWRKICKPNAHKGNYLAHGKTLAHGKIGVRQALTTFSFASHNLKIFGVIFCMAKLLYRNTGIWSYRYISCISENQSILF